MGNQWAKGGELGEASLTVIKWEEKEPDRIQGGKR